MALARLTCALFASSVLISCGGDGDALSNGTHPTPSDPTEYITAEGQAGQAAGGGVDGGLSAGASPDGVDDSKSAQRTVEEGDIYRMLGPGRLLNLNPYRGLQVIDLSDVAQPRLLGRLKEAGTPVEMYVLGQRAVVLLNDWTGYWGARGDVHVEKRSGGLILNVDLSNPEAPVVLDRELVPGNIQTSRLTREGDRAALYVAGPFYDCSGQTSATDDCSGTVVKSIDVSGNDLVPRTTLQLKGYVTAVQATPNAMLVARAEYGSGQGKNTVSLVDISRADGTMVEGAQVPVRGAVPSKFHLDLRGGVLRVTSGVSWFFTQDRTNHIETFDARDLKQVTPIADCPFGQNEQLYASLYLDDRAFVVTYLRTDPFHAFSIDAQGKCQERSKYIVSGWNDFFRPVMQNRRLIGVGVNDEQGRKVAVSLYDITDLDNATPLLARAEVSSGDYSWSSASSDDKAYSVVEDAVSIPAAADPAQLETGLVLMPFYSYGSGGNSAQAGVQIYTFGDHTLTARGTMNHGEMVQRSFRTGSDAAAVTANLSDRTLSLFDTQNPASPSERGRLTLAPNFSDVLDYGSFLVRVRDERERYLSWWSSTTLTPPPSYAEVVPKSGEADTVAPLARIEIPAGARSYRVGALLVTVATVSDWGVQPAKHASTVRVVDLTDPAHPSERGSVTTDRLLPAYGYGWGGGWYGYGRGGFYGGCGVIDGGYYDDFSRTFSNAIVFGRNVMQDAPIGNYEECYASDQTSWQQSCRYDGKADCSWTQGYRSCNRKVDSKTRTCQGDAARCERKDGVTTCTEIDPAEVVGPESCYTSERRRYWQSLELDVLDLRNPSAPALTPVSFAREEETVGLIADGASVYFAFKKPFGVAGDERPFVKHYVREIGLSDPARPVVGNPVNVPGELLAVQGQQLITRDLRWGTRVLETWVHTLQRDGDRAHLEASVPYGGREVTGALVDDAGRLLVTHRAPGQNYYYYSNTAPTLDKLAIRRTTDLSLISEVDVDAYADLTQAVAGRVLFSVPGGMLVVNAQDAAAPYAQAYFPFSGWQRKVTFDGAQILVAAGPYGISQLDATTYNLLAR